MTTRIKSTPVFIAVVFGAMLLASLALALLFPLNVRADETAPPAPLVWTLEHGTVTLLSTPCDNAAVKGIIELNELDHTYQTAAIRWDGKDVAACWALFKEEGMVCIIDEQGKHADVGLRKFKPLVSVEGIQGGEKRATQ